jgi:hypothetical protein
MLPSEARYWPASDVALSGSSIGSTV